MKVTEEYLLSNGFFKGHNGTCDVFDNGFVEYEFFGGELRDVGGNIIETVYEFKKLLREDMSEKDVNFTSIKDKKLRYINNPR